MISRPNRFMAIVELNGRQVEAHIADSGRLKDLLFPGNKVMVRKVIQGRTKKSLRKTQYDLILAAFRTNKTPKEAEQLNRSQPGKETTPSDYTWVSVDSRYPNRLFEKALRERKLIDFQEYTAVRREVAFTPPSEPRLNSRKPSVIRQNLEVPGTAFDQNKNSSKKHVYTRFDFVLEGSKAPLAVIEVKSVTLCRDGIGIFPDVPTERGVRHLNELVNVLKYGYRSYVVFIAQREDVQVVVPNKETDPNFAQMLAKASCCGVKMLAYRCFVSSHNISLDPTPIPVIPEITSRLTVSIYPC